nr:hypothetical protein CFP56_68325 [Quercus suber]
MLLRQRPLAVAAAVVLGLVFLLIQSRPDHDNIQAWSIANLISGAKTATAAHDVAQEIQAWAKLNLPKQFEYQRQCFVAKPLHKARRSSLQNLSSALLGPQDETISLLENPFDGDFPPCKGTIAIHVPPFLQPEKLDTTPLMLGVATTLERIKNSLPNFSRWLSHTGSSLLVLLVDQSDLSRVAGDVEEVVTSAALMGMILEFEPYTGNANDTEGLKNFALALALHENIKPYTKWFGLIDDDTFFVCLRRAYEAIGAYDHSLPWYLGALTEGHTRLKQEGWKAWGGAGFFVSPPLMSILAAHSADCRALDQGFGDLLWRDCILASTSPTVALTELKGLHQIDMWGDVSGFYESGLDPLLTIHHWKSWHFHPIPNAHIVSDVAGPDTFLQRYSFTDGFILTNGFSVAQYPAGMPDLALAELTMVEDIGITTVPDKLEFHRSMGRMRPALELGEEKLQWLFKHSFDDGLGTVRQFYVKAAHPNAVDALDSVIEIDWKRI